MQRKDEAISGLAIVKIASMPLFAPPYLLIIWIFVTKPDFRKLVAYKIIVSIGLMDCLYLVQNLVAGILTFLWSDETHDCVYWRQLHFTLPGLNCALMRVGEVFATMRTGYLLAVPLLSLVLSINRFAVMLNTKKKASINLFCWVAIALSWIIQLPLPYILSYAVNTLSLYVSTPENLSTAKMVLYESDIQFHLIVSSYSYGGPDEFVDFMGLFGPALEIAAFGVNIAVVFFIVLQKRVYGTNFRISPVEVRLIAQGFFVTVPLSIVNACGLKASDELKQTLWFYVSWHFLATLLPVINLAVYIVFNPPARAHMIRMLTKWRKTSTVRVTVTGVAQKMKN